MMTAFSGNGIQNPDPERKSCNFRTFKYENKRGVSYGFSPFPFPFISYRTPDQSIDHDLPVFPDGKYFFQGIQQDVSLLPQIAAVANKKADRFTIL